MYVTKFSAPPRATMRARRGAYASGTKRGSASLSFPPPPVLYWHGVIESQWWLWSLSAGSRQLSADEVQSAVSGKLANMSECLVDAWPRFLD
eukprot:5341480-Pleurochrysis_carterae.AAC.1